MINNNGTTNNNHHNNNGRNGRHSVIKDATKYAEELDLQLWLNFPDPAAVADAV